MHDQRNIAVTSSGLMKLCGLQEFLGAPIVRAPMFARPSNISAVAGWGTKASGLKAESVAARLGIPALHLEDGFLRSIEPGRGSRPYSLVKDRLGIYYDSSRPSDLEQLLNSTMNLLGGKEEQVRRARELIVAHKLSKYNHAPVVDVASFADASRERVLVIDQTVGDTSIAKGSAGPSTFADMLNAALVENPHATIYVKTHPEVSSGKKKGHFGSMSGDPRVVLLTQAMNPMSLVERMTRVYTVTSTMGFEALLAGKPVTCFGQPWYSGWGVTADRQHCARRTARRSIEELFAAAYFHYSTYLNPITGSSGSIFDVIRWLVEHNNKPINVGMR